jgi:predicted lysophospholipase L1 biosynthesis ABC-type transport system permease subunit
LLTERRSARPALFLPLAQTPGDLLEISLEEQGVILAVRASRGSPRSLTRAIAAAAAAVAPDLALTFRSPADEVKALLTPPRLIAMLSGFFGVLALLLAAIGLCGVTAYAVARRRMEIGVRLALGASPRAILRLVLSRVAALVAAGAAIGGLLSLWATRFAASLLDGLAPRDPVTFVGAALVLAAVGALAGALPGLPRLAHRSDAGAPEDMNVVSGSSGPPRRSDRRTDERSDRRAGSSAGHA